MAAGKNVKILSLWKTLEEMPKIEKSKWNVLTNPRKLFNIT